ncbi:phage recombination protein Bet [Pseudorhodoferax sp. Leaf265]|uniref:phage recombination protein Bet n=1 Tax=Pseudorhodoferax sp. Leaf265 TaxID=1736315 RepID=UPI0009EC9904
MTTALVTLTSKLAARLDMGDGAGLMETLKATAFKGQVSDAQMTALLIVANQYGLNPWTKEIYAFPDRNNGIVPVVGVDGWSRIINSHPEFDGMDFEQDDEGCTCRIHRKDRKHPICVTEFMAECRRDGVGPWKSHPRRMLRHKAMIQCARLAFGYGGIYDQDEAERIIDADTGEIKPAQKPAPVAAPELVSAAEAAAARGVQAYQQFWEEAGPVSRKALAAHHERLKAAATTADARTVDVEPKNPPEQEGAE